MRAGDQRRPGHVAVAPGHRQPAVCAPRPRAASFGWLILAAGLTLLIVLGAGWLGSASDGNATVPVPSATTVVSIHSGETLWDVATQEAPGSAPQAVVDRIRQLNNLDDATLYPGEMLRVPVETR
ncbi:MAG TPA: LysM peptidoglycan-binding domain-containing protein [Pseudonocardiaceae bacterium]|nr:LysM peptidoglycan-binding domain-containing protein [Pseudonocardiaceae bacterium]